MEITKNAFGDYLVSKNGVHKGYTLKILGIHKVCNKKGVLIGHILKRGDRYISYDSMGNAIKRGDFDTLLLDFFKQKRAENSALLILAKLCEILDCSYHLACV